MRCRTGRSPSSTSSRATTSTSPARMIDVERGARTSGSRFAYVLGDIVRLHVATVQYAIDKLVGKGFMPVMTPVLVREEALVGSGFFPEAREQVYAVANADPALFLIGTSEVALAALHMGEILPEQALPLRYCGLSSCFRREAGTAGKDMRGHLPDASVREGRDVLVLPSGPFLGGARTPADDRARDRRRARAPLPRDEHRSGRSRRVGGEEVRHRSVAAGPGSLPRADVMLEHDRLPGAPTRRALPQTRAASTISTR